MSSREFSEWQAYYVLEPFGQERDNLHTGIVAATIANAHRDPEKNKPFKPNDFMLTGRGAKVRKQSSGEIYSAFKAWALAMGANKA